MYRFVIQLVFVAGTVDGRWDAKRIFFLVRTPLASVMKSDTPLLPTEYNSLSGTNFEK
jgi:hypothetical protein